MREVPFAEPNGGSTDGGFANHRSSTGDCCWLELRSTPSSLSTLYAETILCWPAICFSAAASFTAAGLLLPIGVQALRRSRSESCAAMRPLAWLPLGFALQQGLEGWIWTVVPS